MSEPPGTQLQLSREQNPESLLNPVKSPEEAFHDCRVCSGRLSASPPLLCPPLPGPSAPREGKGQGRVSLAVSRSPLLHVLRVGPCSPTSPNRFLRQEAHAALDSETRVQIFWFYNFVLWKLVNVIL